VTSKNYLEEGKDYIVAEGPRKRFLNTVFLDTAMMLAKQTRYFEVYLFLKEYALKEKAILNCPVSKKPFSMYGPKRPFRLEFLKDFRKGSHECHQKVYGIDLSESEELHVPVISYYTPSELATACSLKDAKEVNKRLEKYGYQTSTRDKKGPSCMEINL